jgi:hypothetical protein
MPSSGDYGRHCPKRTCPVVGDQPKRLFGNLVLPVGRGRPSQKTSTDEEKNHGQGFGPLPEARTGPLGANVDTKSCVAQEAAGIYPWRSVTT